jgi:hypothetical protein
VIAGDEQAHRCSASPIFYAWLGLPRPVTKQARSLPEETREAHRLLSRNFSSRREKRNAKREPEKMQAVVKMLICSISSRLADLQEKEKCMSQPPHL